MTSTYRMAMDQVKAGRDWSALEQDLLDACALGLEACLPGKRDCPKDQSDPDRRVRPDLIRYLMLGGCENGARPHPKGVMLQGAWIDGPLDMQDCISHLDLGLFQCLFREELNFLDSELGALFLSGSRAESGVDLHRLKTETSVHLRAGFHATGTVNLGSAWIGGQLDCTDGRFDGGLSLEGARIDAALLLRKLTGPVASVDLTEAYCRVLADDAQAWAQTKRYRQSGFTYERLQSDMGISDRLDWLARKSERDLPPEMVQALRAQPWLGKDHQAFDPQPYTQLAKVLEAQGNRGGAARVLEVREGHVRQAAQRRAFAKVDGGWHAAFASVPAMVQQGFDLGFRALFGYGHAPKRAFVAVGLLWLLGYLLYGAAYAAGQMAPNSDVIVTSADWRAGVLAYQACVADCVLPLKAWLATPAAKDYETFSAGLYALDLFVPLDALGQEAAWAPSTSWGWVGQVAYWARMPIQLSGWIITAVGAAVLTGVIGKKE